MNLIAIVGATGKVGYATALALREAGVPVRAILRDASKGSKLREIGCEISVADLYDSGALAKAIGDADGVQLIIPPSPHTDTANEMRAGIESLARAVEEARPKMVLAISDYGAHVDHDIGMPTLCRAFEDRLRKVSGHKLLLRSAEHMQGWGRAIPVALGSGTLPSFHDPLDMKFPTISAPDLGVIAAELWMRPAVGGTDGIEIIHAEGPRRYSANDVAAALSELSGKTINVKAVPRSQWKETFEKGLSVSLADLLIKANDAQNKSELVEVESDTSKVYYGSTDLIDALRPMLPS